MPSFDHDFFIRLFRDSPRLAVELARANADVQLAYDHLTVGDSNLSRNAPTLFFADLVIMLTDADNRPLTGIIIEIQRYIDKTKLRSWPAYITNLRSEKRCPVMLLVIAPDPAVAAWARRSIELGHPGFQLTPIVLGPDNIPRVRTQAAASDLPGLSMLSALTHRDLDLAKLAFNAIQGMPSEQRRLYSNALSALYDNPDGSGGPDEHW